MSSKMTRFVCRSVYERHSILIRYWAELIGNGEINWGRIYVVHVIVILDCDIPRTCDPTHTIRRSVASQLS